MSTPFRNPHVLRQWKPGDKREVSEDLLKKVRLEGRFDSYSNTYGLDGHRRKIHAQISLPTGETLFTLIAVD